MLTQLQLEYAYVVGPSIAKDDVVRFEHDSVAEIAIIIVYEGYDIVAMNGVVEHIPEVGTLASPRPDLHQKILFLFVSRNVTWTLEYLTRKHFVLGGASWNSPL